MRLLICAALLLAVPRIHAQGVRYTGRVIDHVNAEPVRLADVRLLGRDTLRTTTDEAGRWQLIAPAGASAVEVRALGFIPARAAISGDASVPIDVRLVRIPLSLDQVVVTAARRAQRLADVVVTTELLSREDIARSGASDLGAALMASTGIGQAGGHPAGTGLMLQGLGSERVLVLLDGQPMPGRISGEFDVSRIPTANIERVEIVKGPQSTLYGTDAMGGVINVITRPVPESGSFASASVIGGSRSRMDASVAVGGAFGDLQGRLEAGRRFIETTPGRADERGALAERIDAGMKLAWRRSAEMHVVALDERQRWLSGSLYNFADNVQLTARVSAEHSTRPERRLRASVYGSLYDHLSRSSALPQPIRGDTGQRQVQQLAQGELAYTAVLGAHVLDAGVQVRRDETESVRIPGGRRGITTIEPSAQFEMAFASGTSLVTGTRVSHSQRWGTHITPRVAIRHALTPTVTLRASVGTGFRAPDFRELYMRFTNQSVGYAVQGNENLRPETSRNASAGAEWVTTLGYLRGQLFWNEFRGFIETRVVSGPGQPPVYEYANIDDGFTRGVEVEGARQLGRLRADAGYAWLLTGDHSTGQPLLGRPTHSGRLTLELPLAFGVRASSVGIYTGRTPMQRDSSGAVSSWRDAYPRFDLRLARPVTREVELSLSVENVLDRRPAAWAGFTGRQLTAALRWNGER